MSQTSRDVDPALLEVLVCPLTKATLTFQADSNELISYEAGLAFPIRGGIPIMLESEARPLEERERAKPKANAAPA